MQLPEPQQSKRLGARTCANEIAGEAKTMGHEQRVLSEKFPLSREQRSPGSAGEERGKA